MLMILGIFLFGILPQINSVGEISYCCEKTVDGAWCQNAPAESCNTNGFRAVPRSCEATSYCKPGCCYDSQLGTCAQNTPQVVCEENGGTYSDSADCSIPQCELGCCALGDQAAFVTQTMCKSLSSKYGLETNFRKDITSEVECIASVSSNVEGACVFEKDFQRTCRRLSQKECQELETSQNTETEFYEGVLCSAEDLATNCGKSKQTTCDEGSDEVYYLDTCGNLANIYDSTKWNNDIYWSQITPKSNSCGYENANGNAGSSTCGNCDYYYGSTCKAYERGEDRVSLNYGDYICRDLSCDYDGETYAHGSTWCVSNSDTSNDAPGSEWFRMVCYNGDVTVEPCASFRQEICVQGEAEEFGGKIYQSARCSANIWRECIAQDNEKDCTNTDKRDCVWEYTGNGNENDLDNEKGSNYVCVPKFAPGFDFWNEENDGEDICSVADTECTVILEKGLLDQHWNCQGDTCRCCPVGMYEGCTGEEWFSDKMNICTSLGDCGVKENFVRDEGYNEIEDAFTCDGGKCSFGEDLIKKIYRDTGR